MLAEVDVLLRVATAYATGMRCNIFGYNLWPKFKA